MRSLIVFALVSLAVSAHASEVIYIVEGKQADQMTALLALMKNPETNVLKCQPQELKQNKTSITTKNKSK